MQLQLSQKLPEREGIQKSPPLVITSGYNYGRGFHLFISEITFVRINSPTDGRISVEYFSSYQETGLCVLFHRKTYVLQSNHFRIHKHVSESATYSSEEFFGSVNIQFRRMLQFLSGT